MMDSLRKLARVFVRSRPFNWIATSVLSPLTRRRILASRWFITHFPRIGIVKAKMPNGLVLKVDSALGDDPIANQVMWLGWDASEPEAIRLFFRLAFKAQTILDIGAFVGYFSLVASLANPEARVYSFEPVPELQERLKCNIELNGLSNRVIRVTAAVGAANGSAKFFRGADVMPTCSSLSQGYATANCPKVREIDVSVVRLDSWAQAEGLEKVDLIKIDVETGEPDVLAGMKSLFEKCSPDILCEVLHTENTASKLEEILRPQGYRFFLVTKKGPQPMPHIVAHPQWRNYLFSKRPWN